MNTLPLAPLPCDADRERRKHRQTASDGFVDEQLVSSFIARGAYDRVYVRPEGMALSSCRDDYAGWALPVASPFRAMADERSAAPEAPRLPGTPTLYREPGIGDPYQGGHRWWLFGMSGALACGIMALTILSLAQRHYMMGMPAAPISVQHRPEAPAVAKKQAEKQPSLTTILPAEH